MTTGEMQAAAAVIEANVGAIVAKLDNWAKHMAARYNGRVLLVGSTLHHPSPRDCDIRIIVSDDEFAARYGMELRQTELTEWHPLKKRRPELCSARLVHWDADGPTQRWVDDVAKFSGAMSKEIGANMDIKVWPDSYFREPYPRPVVLAEPTPRWFIYNAYVPDPTELLTQDEQERAA